MNKNPFLSSNRHVPHTFSLDPPKNLSSKQNTLKAILNGQITGKSFTSVRQLNPGFFSHMNKSFNALASQIVELEDSITLGDGAKCENCLLSISRKLSELTSAFYSENRDWFVELHGVGLIVRCIEFPPNPQRSHWRIRNQCMGLLRELSFTHVHVGLSLSQNDHLITFLFSLLSDSKTFDGAIGLLEEILGAKEDTFDLSLVPNFNSLVKGMSKAQLGTFCRVLAMVVFEPDDRNSDEIVSSLELLKSRKRGRYVTLAVRNIDRNHAIVIGIPNLLERLVRLLRGTNHPNSSLAFPSVTDLLTYQYLQSGRNSLAGYGGDDDNNNDNNENDEEDDDEDYDDEEEDEEGEDEDDDMEAAADAYDALGEEEDGEGAEEDEEEDESSHRGAAGTRHNSNNTNNNNNNTGNNNEVERRGNRPNGLQGLMAGIAEGLGINGLDNLLGGVGGGDGDIRMLYNMDQELEQLMTGTAQNLKDLALSAYQVELLFVLYALLAGKRKAELQDKLASLGLIHTATLLFDKTDWLKQPPALPHHHHHHHGNNNTNNNNDNNNNNNNNNDNNGDNNGNNNNDNNNQHSHECHSDAALKIQLLRLILNFCDGDFENRANKRLLLSKEEIANLHLIHPTPGVTYNVSPSHKNARLCNTSGPGLLSKLISVFYKLPQDQNNRFWMASCIEAFLRGSEPVFQNFVAQSGMLSYLIEEIVSDANKVQGSLQTSFDLLGELMKFNREIFVEFNEILVGDKATKFFNSVMSHLVDSNVFLRGMVLSVEKFKEEDAKYNNSTTTATTTTTSSPSSSSPSFSSSSSSSSSSHIPYSYSNCKISQFLEQHWFKLVRDLMTVVSIEAINQENICCVNTTMVFFIYARRKGQLQSFIQTTRDEEENCIKNLGPTAIKPNVTNNFQKLLWFWHEYYLLRGKDSLSLEYTSQIKFSEWTATYELLVEELGQYDSSQLFDFFLQSKKENGKMAL